MFVHSWSKATLIGHILKVTHQGQNRGKVMMSVIALFYVLPFSIVN